MLPIPPLTSRLCQLHPSTGRYPIIHTLTLQMTRPPQSATPHHIRHTLHTQKTVTNPHCVSYASATHLKINPTHHHPFHPLRLCRFAFFIAPISVLNYWNNRSSLGGIWCWPWESASESDGISAMNDNREHLKEKCGLSWVTCYFCDEMTYGGQQISPLIFDRIYGLDCYGTE